MNNLAALSASLLFVASTGTVGVAAAEDKARAKPPGPCDQRAVARHFVVLGRLCGSDESCVQHLLVIDIATYLISLCKDAVDRLARGPAWVFTPCISKYLFDPLDVWPRCFSNSCLELRVRRLVNHLGQ